MKTKQTMNKITNFDYKGKLIQQREDGYINLSQMCQANKKKLNDFLRLKSTKLYLESLSQATGIPVGQIIEVQNGNQTWGHKSLSIRLSQWISSDFAVWCDAHLFVLLSKGSTSLEIDPLEELRLKAEISRNEQLAAKYTHDTLALKNYVATELPKPIGDRILGVTEVKEIEYRDRTFVDDDLIDDGSTVTKAFLCKRYGLTNRNGGVSYTALNKFLAQVGADKDEHLWDSTMSVRTSKQFKRECLPLLDKAFEDASRQLFLGE